MLIGAKNGVRLEGKHSVVSASNSIVWCALRRALCECVLVTLRSAKREGKTNGKGRFAYLTSRASAMMPAARGAAADVPVCLTVHELKRSVVACGQKSPLNFPARC
jgi:hypothetical protein